MTTRHKHADLIIAWANGAVIEYLNSFGEWEIGAMPSWNTTFEYRIKPAPMVLFAAVVGLSIEQLHCNRLVRDNVKITIDPLTYQLLTVEKI